IAVDISSTCRLLHRTPTIREGRCLVDEHAVSSAGVSPLVAEAVHAAGGAGDVPRRAAPAGGRRARAGELPPAHLRGRPPPPLTQLAPPADRRSLPAPGAGRCGSTRPPPA